MAKKQISGGVHQSRFLRPKSSGYESIGSYAIIGNSRSAALVSKFGSIDWLCWPRFDSSSIFCALLDHSRGGRFSLTPQSILSIERAYEGETNVLTTIFRTADGILKLTDLMTMMSEEDKETEIAPEHEILRLVECLQGSVSIDILFEPRPEFGKRMANLKSRPGFGCTGQFSGQSYFLHTNVPLSLSTDGGRATACITLHAEERREFSLTYSDDGPSIIPPLGNDATRRLTQSLAWWNEWSGRCCYNGPFRNEVIRSALTLKLLVYAPSGAIIAAPTTSLPEAIGEGRNWDYRYCWLRDASLSIAALMDLGYSEEGEAFLSWILHATRTTQPDVRILYDVFGNANLSESILDHLEGYRSSSPVRVGNAAKDQLQLDVYGEILLAVKEFTDRGGTIDRTEAAFLEGIGQVVLRRWREPDDGIWEARSGRVHHTYSKVMCWSALNTLLHLHDLGHIAIDRRRYVAERESIRQDVELHGYDDALQSYTGAYGQSYADASLLLLGYVGFTPPGSRRMQNTYRRIRSTLSNKGLLRRYPPEQQDGLTGTEGTFGLCTLWEIQYLVREKRLDAAREAFKHFLSFGNDLGLFAEEIHAETGEALGNFPQAFTHLGIIDVALSMENRERAVRHHHQPPEEA